MNAVRTGLQVLGLASRTPARRPRPAPTTAPTTTRRRIRVRAGASSRADGTRRAVIDAEVLLDGPPAPPPRRPSALVALGLAHPPVVVAGHPRIRQRILADVTRQRRREQALAMSVGLVMALVLLAWGLVRSPLLAVEAVDVVGVDAATGGALAAHLPVTAGQNILDVDLAAVEHAAADLPWVAEASVVRRLPSTVEVRVSTRRPVLVGEVDGTRWLLDPDARVLGQLDGARTTEGLQDVDLPVVQLLHPPTDGQVVGVLQPAAHAARDMPRGMGEWITGYRVTPDGEVDANLAVPTDMGPWQLTAHLGRPEDIPAKATTLASLVRQVMAEGGRPSAIDVRIADRPSLLP